MASTFKRRSAGSKPLFPADRAGDGNDAPTSSSSPVLSHFLNGTKPWTAGITLTSTGLREFDTLLTAAGQPLGTCIYLEEDRWTQNLALCLVKYWCAEAICQGQELFFPVDEEEKLDGEAEIDSLSSPSSWTESNFSPQLQNVGQKSIGTCIREMLHSLPRNLHKDKQDQKEQHPQSNSSDNNAKLGALTEGDEEEEDNEENQVDGEKLQNAWQYSKEVQEQRLGLTLSESTSKSSGSSAQEVFCHSFDLSGRLEDQMNVMDAAQIMTLPSCFCHGAVCRNGRQCGFQYFCSLAQQLQTMVSSKPNSVIRIVFYRPLNPSSLNVALPLLLTHIRAQKLPIVVMVVVQPWISTPSTTLPLQRCSDVVVETEGFASRREYPPPPEFRMFQGLLKIRKMATVTAATALGSGHFADFTINKRPPANLYGLKRDRRKLNIQLLHIPPEDYAAAGGSVGGGGVRSGAGRVEKKPKSTGLGCASSGGAGNSQLDF